MILITDDREAARAASAQGIVCIGCARGGHFFDGAALVAEDPEELDAALLEEVFRHEKGVPVTIARTERLVLREMMPQDFERLRQISRQEGTEYLMGSGQSAAAFFSEENLRAYIACAYRFFGYGLWSVLLADGTLIGCCGFSDGEAEVEPPPGVCGLPDGEAEVEPPPGVCGLPDGEAGTASAEKMAESGERRQSAEPFLELQYMLDVSCRRKGYGTEMCTAALRYAALRTQVQEVQISCRPENAASKALALRLGFVCTGPDKAGILRFRYPLAAAVRAAVEKADTLSEKSEGYWQNT